jgi:7-cyano-7-deazaguanine synthase
MKRLDKILLFSGGLDSLVCWFYLGKPKTLFVNVGQRYFKKEDACVKKIAKLTKMRVLYNTLRAIGKWEKPDADIPQRNMFLLQLGANYADEVYLTIQKDEFSIPDRKPEFFKKAAELVGYLLEREIKFPIPFENMDKFDLIKWYKDNGHPIDLLYETVGCYDKGEGHCGNCGACLRRFTSLIYNDIDPRFKLKREIVEQYLKKFKENKYSPERTKKSLEAFEKAGITKNGELQESYFV